MLGVKYSGLPVRHGLAIILRSKSRIFTKLSEVILLSFLQLLLSFIQLFNDTDWTLVKNPEATQYPGLKAACDITG